MDNPIIEAVNAAKKALAGYSNDEEHDALVGLLGALGVDPCPEDNCDCESRSWYGDEHDSACPVTLWLNEDEIDHVAEAIVTA